MIKESYTVALAGNPNVGKSTVFNCLTGLHQHTGNWAGKTVENARGRYIFENDEYTLVDLPGTYSLFSHSYEEERAEEFLCFGECDAAVVVADGNCLERNLNLVLQILQITDNVILAVNLMDEAEKNGVKIDFDALSDELKIPVVPMSAGRKKGLNRLKNEIADACKSPPEARKKDLPCGEVGELSEILNKYAGENTKNIYYAVRLLCDEAYIKKNEILNKGEILESANLIREKVCEKFGSIEGFSDFLTDSLTKKAEQIAERCVSEGESLYKKRLMLLDRIFTGKFTGIFTMLVLLLLILWITLYGANYPRKYFRPYCSALRMI